MIQALSCEGLGPVKNLEELVGLAAKSGFPAVDVAPPMLRDAVSRLGMEGVKTLLEGQGVRVGSFPTSAWWIDDESTFRQSMGVQNEDAGLYEALGCRICHTFIMPCCNGDTFSWTATATRRIRLLADMLAGYGMKLALEYVGPHRMRKKRKNIFIHTARQTLQWLNVLERRNIGLLLDAFHWYTAGETADDLRAVPAEAIYHVHLNDAPQLPVAEIEDNNRLYPGEGVIDIETFIGVLREKGYNGIVAQEVLQPVTPKKSNEALAHYSKVAMDRYL